MGACGSVFCKSRNNKSSSVFEDRNSPLEPPRTLPSRPMCNQQEQAHTDPLTPQKKRKLRFRRKTSTGSGDHDCVPTEVQPHQPAAMDFSAAPWIRALMAPENAPHLVLGVTSTSSREDIRRAYRQWSLRANMGPPATCESISPSDARLAIQKVTKAYNTLLVNLEAQPVTIISVSGHQCTSSESLNEGSGGCCEASKSCDSFSTSTAHSEISCSSSTGSFLKTCYMSEEESSMEEGDSDCSTLGQRGSPVWLPISKRQFLASNAE